MTDRINLTMSVEDASHLGDAINYYLLAASNNYGAGYEPGSEYDGLERDQYESVQGVSRRLNHLIENRTAERIEQ